MTLRHSSLFCGAVATVLLSFSASADDWPQWRGPKRDGISTEKGWKATWPATGPKKLWSKPVGIGYSSMAVADGRIYTMGNVENQDVVSCFNAETGDVVWKHEYACPAKDPNGYHGTRVTPTVDGDNVFTLSRHGHLFCLDAKTGKVKWTKNLISDLGGREIKHSGGREGWGYSASPLVEKDMLLVEPGGEGASVVALDKKTGKAIWKNGNDIAGYASMVAFDLEGERCFTHFAADHFVVRRMKDGSELWRHPWKTSYGVNAATPIVQGDTVFISSGYSFGCARLKMTKAGVTEMWRNKNMRNHVNSCVLLGDHLYGFDESELKCLDWNTGEVKWAARGYGKGSLMAADGKLILFSQNGKLGIAEADPTAFKELSSVQVLQGKDTWAHPVLANGRIYVRNVDTLVALDVK
jgi:outer membrane protein assembly factor BamB